MEVFVSRERSNVWVRAGRKCLIATVEREGGNSFDLKLINSLAV